MTYYDYTGGYPNNPEDYISVPNPDLVNPGPVTRFDNVIVGTAGADTLTGTDGNDDIYGGAGNDFLSGGLGDDSYHVTVGDQVEDSGGIDTIYFSGGGFWRLAPGFENIVADGTGAVDFRGNNDANVMIGGPGNDYMNGRAGDDTMIGLGGNDNFDMSTGRPSNAVGGIWTMGNRLIDGGDGTDTIDYDGYARSAVTIDLGAGTASGGGDLGIGTARLISIERAVGGAYDDYIKGSDVANDLFGRGGNDTLDGGLGADKLQGGVGNDTYYVDNSGDLVQENAGEGNDSVFASLSWTLGSNVENLTLTGTAAINATGNGLNNVLTGNSGSNILNGGAGSDTLIGGAGDDTYVVDSADTIVENAGEGIDTVNASFSYTLGANLENLSLSGTSRINGTGNALDNVLTGNSANNTLAGGDGDDKLDGAGGRDTLIGGAGNDSYVVDVSTDSIVENADQGIDTVNSSISWTLGANLENLTLTGSAAINGTGNSLDNVLTGNSAVNRLDGGLGNDSYYVTAGDVLVDSGGVDTVYSGANWNLGSGFENLTAIGSAAVQLGGNNLDNVLVGNDADNYFNSLAGNDTMIGNGGNDNFDMSTGGTSSPGVRYVDGGSGIDTVDYDGYAKGALSADLAAGTVVGGGVGGAGSATLVSIERFVGGSFDDRIVGSTDANDLFGRGGNDTLDGGAGNDLLIGGTGSDTYQLGRGYDSDRIQENDATANVTDTAQFLDGIATDQLWFQQAGNNLVVSVIGTADQFSVDNWYLGSQYQVEQFKTAAGSTLLASQVQNLVDAMAAFAPPAAGQTTLPDDYATQLAPVIAANWG